MGEAELVDERIDGRGSRCARSGGRVSVTEVFGVAVELLLAFLSTETGCFSTTYDAAVTFTDTSTETAEYLAVLVSPAPETIIGSDGALTLLREG